MARSIPGSRSTRMSTSPAWAILLALMAVLAPPLGAQGSSRKSGGGTARATSGPGSASQLRDAIRRKDYAMIYRLAAEIRSRGGASGKLMRLQGIAASKLGRDEEAVDAFQAALALDPGDEKSAKYLRVLRSRAGKNDSSSASSRSVDSKSAGVPEAGVTDAAGANKREEWPVDDGGSETDPAASVPGEEPAAARPGTGQFQGLGGTWRPSAEEGEAIQKQLGTFPVQPRVPRNAPIIHAR